MTLMEAWYATPATWDVATLGPAPGQPGCLVPMQASMMFARRLERREKQVAEDFKLLDQLLTACHGNYHRTARSLTRAPSMSSSTVACRSRTSSAPSDT